MEKQRFEFQKLDEIDLSVAEWINDHHPKALPDYINYLVSTYQKNGVILDGRKLFEELKKELNE